MRVVVVLALVAGGVALDAPDASGVPALRTLGSQGGGVALVGTSGAFEIHRPPVDAPVVDDFRAPPEPWSAGNRGIDYATAPGASVAASAGGQVTFAGPVGGQLHVTIAHPDGLRTTYAFLATISVTAGDVVPAGGVVGTSAGRFHFGVRDAQGNYLDPSDLLAVGVARLVPGGDDGAVVVAGPVGPGVWAIVADLLAGGVRIGSGAPVSLLPGAAGIAPALVHYVDRFAAAGVSRDAALALLAAALADPGPCTLADVPPPSPTGRRVLVLVAGFGSTSGHTGVDDVDAAGLGYAAADVVRFSYAGGRAPAEPGVDVTPLGALPTSDYTSAHSLGDLPSAGDDLADLLGGIAAVEPGVPIDVVAHSQGGVVARIGLSRAAGRGALPPEVQTLVTLGSPHHGADLATAGAAIASTPRGAAALDLAGALGLPVAGDSAALHQLSEASAIASRPGDAGQGTPFPSGVRFTSVGARGDPVVPLPRTLAPGAATTTVSVAGVGAHDALPGSPEATREIALAVGGLPPTCRSRGDRLVDVAVGHGIAAAHDGAGAALVGLAALL